MKGTKIIAAVIAGALTLGTITVPDIRIPQISIVADAADEIVYGDYKYTINTDSNGEYAEITRYIGSDSIVVVPSKLGGVPVKSIGVAAFGALDNDTSERGHAKECVQKVTIPEGVTTIKKWAFNQCKNLQSISLPDSLETIGLQAFWLCDSLESITIPKNASNPDGCAFWACRGLKEVVFSKGVTEISYEMFRTCTSLNSVTIPNTVTSIGNQAFGGCKNLKEINIPDSVETLGESAFSGCETLSKVKLSDNITSIQKNTFYGCTSLKEISLPYYTSTIGKDAFYNVPLEVITIGTKLKSIENLPIHQPTLKAINVSEDNFYYSSDNGILYDKKKSSLIRFPAAMNKTEYKSPDTLLNIGESAFADNSNIRNVYLYEKCSSVEPTAFQNCTHLDKIYFYNKNCEIYMSKNTIYADAVINGYKDSTAEEYANTYGRAFVNLSDEIIDSGMCGENLTWTLSNKGILSISGTGKMTDYNPSKNPVPWNSSDIISIIIGEGVTDIGDEAFANCEKITSITLPYSVKRIGVAAFYSCINLNKISMSNNVVIIEACAFENCQKLTSIIVPNSVTSIGDSAFMNCSSLSSVTIPQSVTEIGGWAFAKTIWLDDKRKENPFVIVNGILIDAQNCDVDGNVMIPNNVVKIGDHAFQNCYRITSITIPQSVKSIGAEAFFNCRGLTSITIPNNVNSIGYNAFYNCSNLTTISIPDSVVSIGFYAFAETPWLYDRIEENPLVIVNGILIDGIACKGDITIPDTVNSIVTYAFDGCDISSITIPKSVVNIGESAFSRCGNLKTVTIMNPECKMDDIFNKYSYYNYNTDIKIIGYTNSTAQDLANEYGFVFRSLGEVPQLYGDVNNDGTISIADAVSLQNFLLGRTKTLGNWKNADLCKDNRIDVFDMVLMRRLLIEKMN